MMTLDDFLKLARAGRPLASAETLEFMDRMSDEARRIPCRLNASYHTPDEGFVACQAFEYVELEERPLTELHIVRSGHEA